jgi:hypothetical protein
LSLTEHTESIDSFLCVLRALSEKFMFLHSPNVYKRTQKHKVSKIYFFFLILLLFCKTSNSGFIRESDLIHHNLEINLSDIHPRIEVLANTTKQVELKPLRLVLDTGSNISLIRKNIFPTTGYSKSFRIKSITGEIEEESSEIKLDIYDQKNNLIRKNLNFHAMEFDKKFSFDGIIGNDILGKFDLFLEMPDSIYLINPIPNKSLTGFRKIPFEFSEGHIIISAVIQNKPCKFILDTGAGISYMNQKKAQELELKIGGNASFMDLRGEIQETIYHLGENLCVDENLCQKKIELLSGNSIEDFLSDNGKLDGILGLNWIENFSILVDYQNLILYIKKR